MELAYKVNDRPPLGKTLIFALQQLLAILAATIAVPAAINGNLLDIGLELNMSQSAALFGAGMGTIVYLLFTKSKSPVFLGSSFAFIGSMTAAFSGAVANGILYESLGYLGLIIGATVAGLVYVIIAVVVKLFGVKWIDKLMPPVVIGPTVALIGLSFSGSAIKSLVSYANTSPTGAYIMTPSVLIGMLCGFVTLAVVIICSVFGKKMVKMIPFILGIVAGYIVASLFTACGWIFHNDALKIIDFTVFAKLSEASSWYPSFTFVKAFGDYGNIGIGGYIGTIVAAYAPVAFVVFAEHIADHKNLSSIIGNELLEDPGLHRTLLGDGVGSVAGALFGGCANTTYGESVGCVAISGNASVFTIWTTAIMCIAISFVAPFVLFLGSIPNCVMGGVCVALYGFIAVSGLKMIQPLDLGDNRNLFVISTILITGIGGIDLQFGQVTITNIAVALILGILANLLCSIGKNKTESASK